MAEYPQSLEELVRPHMNSFDIIGEGLQNIVELLKPAEVCTVCLNMFSHLLDDFNYLMNIFMSGGHPKLSHLALQPWRLPFS